MSHENVQSWLVRAAALLAEAGIEDSRFEARLLLAEAAGWPAETIIARHGQHLPEDAVRRAEMLLQRRCRRQPASHILGRREFWGMEFEVRPEALDPRPDSETVVAAALAQIGNRAVPFRVLDFGTGTGCLLLALLSELPNARGVGLDLSEAAARLARANAERLGLSSRAQFVVGDWGEGLAGEFDVIVSNPPYVPTAAIGRLQPEVALWEPRLALDGGKDGLEAYRKLGTWIAGLLHPNGFAAIEIGWDQASAVGGIVGRSGLTVLCRAQDLGGRDRCLLLGHGHSRAKKQLEKGGLPSRVGSEIGPLAAPRRARRAHASPPIRPGVVGPLQAMADGVVRPAGTGNRATKRKSR
ncbi:MAG TPA: peptide chain release factor N(5)-glutamine methyltransferase [Alphaproteobacteria bacterium]|nr:peptide chain release factor N(5)-glutamine methyltransferase [Alphaproteobacteria bacterium]